MILSTIFERSILGSKKNWNFEIDKFEFEELNVDIWFFIFSVHRFLSRVSILYFSEIAFLDFEPILECQKNPNNWPDAKEHENTRKNLENVFVYVYQWKYHEHHRKWAKSTLKWMIFSEKLSKLAKNDEKLAKSEEKTKKTRKNVIG